MPSYKEILELRKKCDWTWITIDGVDGFMVTSRNNGNSIFLPAAGSWDGDELRGKCSMAMFWSSTLGVESKEAYALSFTSRDANDVSFQYSYNRYYGCSIRPVVE